MQMQCEAGTQKELQKATIIHVILISYYVQYLYNICVLYVPALL